MKIKMLITFALLLQNGGAGTVISQYWFGGQVLMIELGVVLPKHKAYVVELLHAKRLSKLHVPHDGGQSAGIVDGLPHISGELLQAVNDGQVYTAPDAAP